MTAVSPDEMDLVFQALASPARRRMLDIVQQRPGCCVNEMCEHFATSRIAVMKHLKVLVAAQLIISRKTGRMRQLFFNAAPIQMIYDRWTTEYSGFWASQVVDLKYKVEGKKKSQKASSSRTRQGQRIRKLSGKRK